MASNDTTTPAKTAPTTTAPTTTAPTTTAPTTTAPTTTAPTTPVKFKLSEFSGHARALLMNGSNSSIRLIRHGQRGYRWNIISVVKKLEDGAAMKCVIEGKDGQKREAHSSDLLVDPVSAAWASREERRASSVPTATPAEENAAMAALAAMGFE